MNGSPRLSERLRGYRGLCKAFFVEDIIVYSTVICGSLGFDFVYSLAGYLRLHPGTHPISFGVGQLIVAGTFTFLLVRKAAQWKSLKKL